MAQDTLAVAEMVPLKGRGKSALQSWTRTPRFHPCSRADCRRDDIWSLSMKWNFHAIYGNIYHQYTPNARIYTSTMDPMGKIGAPLNHPFIDGSFLTKTMRFGVSATAIRLVRSLSHGEHQLLLGSGGAPF